MSSTNKTANYKLSQFIGTDKPTFLGDYNNDMQIIDGAIFEANQSAEQALNDVEAVKGAQEELKNVHAETQKQVAQLKDTADGMSGDVTAAQEAANSAEQKATEAQTAATGVVNAANAAIANATKAKQTADGNATTIARLSERVKALEENKQVIALELANPTGAFKGQTFNDIHYGFVVMYLTGGFSESITGGNISFTSGEANSKKLQEKVDTPGNQYRVGTAIFEITNPSGLPFTVDSTASIGRGSIWFYKIS